MVLAAGEGHRLHPLTERKPKPMLDIGGHPALEYNIRLLVHYGFTEIVVNVHHFANVIVDYFGNGAAFGAAITYSHEERLLGTAGGLAKVQDFFGSDSFMLVYGDNLSNCRLDFLAKQHRHTEAAVTMALFKRLDVAASGIVGLKEDDRITKFLEKPRENQIFSNLVNAGILMMETDIFQYIPPAPCDLSLDVLPAMLQSDERLFGYRMTEELWWIDSLSDYQQTTQEFCKLAFPFMP